VLGLHVHNLLTALYGPESTAWAHLCSQQQRKGDVHVAVGGAVQRAQIGLDLLAKRNKV
jgi:hypothetical protein